MKTEKSNRNHKFILTNDKLNFSLNLNSMHVAKQNLDRLKNKFTSAHAEMLKIESGEIKNPDEHRKVTHFTDRISYPNEPLFNEVENFAKNIRSGKILGSTQKRIEYVVINGIGGSALGPQLLQFAINGPYWNELTGEKRRNYPKIYFLDNTDPAEIKDLLSILSLDKSLIVNISKSGTTQETKNNIIALKNAYKNARLNHSKHFCAITMQGSALDKEACSENWLKIFPMAESIGGRTSETSIVGHLPAALAGIDFRSFLRGACEMDSWTRESDYKKNPASLLAATWYIAGNGKGNKNMVIVPYSDRLVLLAKYLQQLVMESLGKEKDLDGKIVHQGLTVFGNKGGTDAHAYIQQLNDGRNDFFVTFIEVLKDAMSIPVSTEITMGDYLHCFQAGLANALINKNRDVIQIQISEINPFNLGAIIALYERAVAIYAEFIHINAFHQPGVQAYKLVSSEIIRLTTELKNKLTMLAPWEGTIKEFCKKLRYSSKEAEVDSILAKIAANNNQNTFEKFTLARKWSIQKGWLYSLKKK